MAETPPPGREPPLNPALRPREDNSYDLTSSKPPVDTASAKEGEGEGWPWVWLLVVVAGAVLAIYFVV